MINVPDFIYGAGFTLFLVSFFLLITTGNWLFGIVAFGTQATIILFAAFQERNKKP